MCLPGQGVSLTETDHAARGRQRAGTGPEASFGLGILLTVPALCQAGTSPGPALDSMEHTSRKPSRLLQADEKPSRRMIPGSSSLA